jgi:hypothetical protein
VAQCHGLKQLWRQLGRAPATRDGCGRNFHSIRPTGNELPGYVPSYAINRLQDESS